MVFSKGILYWPSYRSEISCFGPEPNAKAIDRGVVTGPIRNDLIKETFFQLIGPQLNPYEPSFLFVGRRQTVASDQGLQYLLTQFSFKLYDLYKNEKHYATALITEVDWYSR